MVDWLSREQRSRNMASIKSKGNASTEQAFVQLLRAAQISGWRRHLPLPGKPDFTFRSHRIVVFIDGCFWHRCPRCYRLPEENREYWKAKALMNRRRDRRSARELRSLNWQVLRVWEHSLKSEEGREKILTIRYWTVKSGLLVELPKALAAARTPFN
jgi:DNA mismatch endonuclease (patch repair protein)